MLDFLKYLFRPSYWISNYPVSNEWDRELNKMMDKGTPVFKVDHHHVKIGKTIVWIKNYPYAFGRANNIDALPKRKTRERFAGYVAINTEGAE